MKSVAKFLGKTKGHYHFSVVPDQFDAVRAWLDDQAFVSWDWGTYVPDHFPDLKIKKPTLGVSFAKVSEIIHFESQFPVAGLTPKVLYNA
jgi:hypothetical protein